MKGFALGLALKQGRKATRKSPNTRSVKLQSRLREIEATWDRDWYSVRHFAPDFWRKRWVVYAVLFLRNIKRSFLQYKRRQQKTQRSVVFTRHSFFERMKSKCPKICLSHLSQDLSLRMFRQMSYFWFSHWLNHCTSMKNNSCTPMFWGSVKWTNSDKFLVKSKLCTFEANCFKGALDLPRTSDSPRSNMLTSYGACSTKTKALERTSS